MNKEPRKNRKTSKATSVLLVDADDSRGSILRKALRDFSFELLASILDVDEMLEKVSALKPDVIIVGIDLPDKRTLEQLAKLDNIDPHPVVMFAEKDTPRIIEKTIQAGVTAFIVDDIQAHRLPSIINIAIARFDEKQHLVSELNETKSKLAERKLIEKAKGILMKSKGISEEEAYRSIRTMAMNKGKSISAVAENIIETFDILVS
jgi:response regulator NasT